jgi:CheY-like chemotaxis protein
MHTPRILLIEADQDTHRGLRDRLERRGCEVFSARTQAEAVHTAAEIEADLVVQENTVALTDRPAMFDEVMDAIEVLAGPLPGTGTAAPLGGRKLLPRARRVRALLVPAGSC